MKTKECKVGMHVAFKYSTQPCLKGIIKTEVDHNTVIVEWEGGSVSKVEIKYLLTKKQGLEYDLQLREKRTQIENEWSKTEPLIKKKIQEAANALDEANALAKGANKSLYDMSDLAEPLMESMRDAGWNSSSWGC
jgi:hypothetical protein